MRRRGHGRRPANVEVIVGDAEHLPFEAFSFDVAATLRTLHHTPRPEQVIAELARVTVPGGTMLVVDQLAPTDPLAAVELNRFERARDPSTTRVLADADMRGLFDANGLRPPRQHFDREPRDLEAYLDLAGCEGPQREEVRTLVLAGTRRSSAGTCSNASDRPRQERLHPRGRPVRPRHHDLPLVRSTASRIRSTTAGSITSRRERAGTRSSAGSPLFRRSRVGTGVQVDSARRELDGDRARERELCVLRRRVRADRDGAGDGDDVDDVGAWRKPGRNATDDQTAPR